MSNVVLSIDVDWAPDCTIFPLIDQLVEKKVKSTWFITHASPALDRLKQHPELFELGIHPNFMTGSTHGTTTDEVLKSCFDLVPNATVMRTHCLFQSTRHLETIALQTSITTDASLFLPRIPFVQTLDYQFKNKVLKRVPLCWEDDLEMNYDDPQWRLAPILEQTQGVRVFDLHPIHIALNSGSMEPYQTLKNKIPNMLTIKENDLTPYINNGLGTRTLYTDLLDYFSQPQKSTWISEVS